MKETQMTTSAIQLLLADILAGQLAAPLVRPFTNDVDPGASAVLSDFTPATFAGSAAKAIGTWVGPYVTAAGTAEAIAPQLVWSTDGVIPETVYGFTIVSAGAGTPFLGYMRLDTAKRMATATDVLPIVPRFQQPASGFGSFVQTAD